MKKGEKGGGFSLFQGRFTTLRKLKMPKEMSTRVQGLKRENGSRRLIRMPWQGKGNPSPQRMWYGFLIRDLARRLLSSHDRTLRENWRAQFLNQFDEETFKQRMIWRGSATSHGEPRVCEAGPFSSILEWVGFSLPLPRWCRDITNIEVQFLFRRSRSGNHRNIWKLQSWIVEGCLLPDCLRGAYWCLVLILTVFI